MQKQGRGHGLLYYSRVMHAAENDPGCSELPPDEPPPPLSGGELAFSFRPVGGDVNDNNPCICLS